MEIYTHTALTKILLNFKLKSFLFSLFFLFSIHFTQAQTDYYWVNQSGDADWGNPANWSATSGGSGGIGIPTSSDRAIFDISTNCVINGEMSVAYMDIRNTYAGVIAANSNAGLAIYTSYSQDGGILDFSLGSYITFVGNLTFTNGVIKSPAFINLYNTTISSIAPADFQAGTGTVLFYNSVNMTYNANNLIFNNITFSNPGNVNLALGSFIQANGNLYFDNTGQINQVATGGLRIGGDLTIAGLGSGGGNAELHFVGGNNQYVNLTGFEASFNGSIFLDKTAGNVFMQSDLILDAGSLQSLNFNNGILFTNGHSVTFGLNNIASSGNTNSYIEGKVRRTGFNSFIFPIGRNGIYAPIQTSAITNLGVNDYLEAEYFNQPYNPYTNISSPLSKLSRKEYWSLKPSKNLGTTANITLSWNQGSSFSEISDLTDLRMVGLNGTTWDEIPTNLPNGDINNGFIDPSGNIDLDTYTYFTFASATNNLAINPLGVISGDACQTPIAVNIGDTNIPFDIRAEAGLNGNTSFSTSCGSFSPLNSVKWAKFTGDGSQVTITFNPNSGQNEVGLEVFTTVDCSTFTDVACYYQLKGGPPQITINTTSGTDYYIRVVVSGSKFPQTGFVSLVKPPQVTLDSNPAIPAANILPGTTDVIIYRVDLNIANSNTGLKTASFTTSGTYDSNDINGFNLYYSSDATWDVEDYHLGSVSSTSFGSGENLFFNIILTNEVVLPLSVGTGYLFLLADISANANPNTIQVNGSLNTDFNLTFGSITNTVAIPDGGVQTIVDLTSDFCQGATPINVGDCNITFDLPVNYTNTGGTVSAPCSLTSYKDIWYSFSTPTTSAVRIEITNLNEDAGIAIYNGACGSLTQLDCANGVVGLGTETISLTASGQTTYYIRIMNVNADNSMAGVICIRRTSLAPIGDLLKEATDLTLGNAAIGFNLTNNFRNYEGLGNAGCVSNNSRLDAWAKFTATAGETSIQYVNTNKNAGLAAYSIDANGNLTEESCIDNVNGTGAETLDVTTVIGQTYYVRIMNVSDNNAMSGTIKAFNSTPIVPKNLISSNITDVSFTLNWDIVPSAVDYRVDVATNNTFTTFVSGFQNVTVNTNTLDVNGLAVGTTYYVRVRSVNAGGTSTNSTTLTVATLPGAPVAISAIGVQSTQFTAKWNTVSGATEYWLDVASTSTFDVGTFILQDKIVSQPLLTYAVNAGIASGNIYYYRLRAKNGGGLSAYSNVISVITNPIATAATNISTTGFTANWNQVIGAIDYRLDISFDNFATFVSGFQDLSVGNVNNYAVTGLNSAADYQYRIRVVDANSVVSPNSNVIQVSTVPLAPTALAATNLVQTSFTANWQTITGADGYKIDVSTDNFVSFVPGFQNRDVGNISSISVNSLIVNTLYQYRVRAYNGVLSSTNSNIISVTTLPNPPVTPVAIAATNINQNDLTANWQTSAGATAYFLDVSDNQSFTTFVSGFQNLNVGNNLSQLVNGLSIGTTYYYRVRANNIGGTSANSNIISQITIANAPVAQAATNVIDISFSANWAAVTSAEAYVLDVATDNLFTNFVSGFQNLNVGNVLTKSVTGLSPSTDYFYRVRTVNNSGNGISPNSNTISLNTTPSIPTAPVALAATGVNLSDFTANWQASAGTSAYFLDVSDNQNFTTFVSGFQNLNVGTNLSQLVNGLNAGTTYFYRLRANNAGGTSGNSNVISQITIPSAPVATNANPIAGTSFTANWNQVIGASSYRLDVATDNAFSSLLSTYSDLDVGNNISTSVTGLNFTTTYYYRVRAINSAGLSTNSNIIQVLTTPDLPVAPNALPASTVSQTGFTANWQTSVGATTYRLDVSKDVNFGTFVIQNLDVNTNVSFDLTNLSSGTTYFYRVRGVNTVGSSLNSNVISQITIPANPSAISASNILLAANNSSFQANWNPSTGASSYLLEVATDITFAPASILPNYDGIDVGNVTSKAITGLTLGETYYYRLKASNSAGLSNYSNIISVTLAPSPADIPTVPSGLSTFSSSEKSIEISFTDNSNIETGFELQRAADINGSYNTIYTLNANVSPAPNTIQYIDDDNGAGLTPKTTYYYRVRALGSLANSVYTTPASGATLSDAPITPSDLEAFTKSSTEILLVWEDKSNNEDGFYIYRRTEQSALVKVATIPANLITGGTVRYVDTGLTPETIYLYRVVAFRGSSESDFSNLAAAFTTAVPNAPTNMLATATGQRAIQLNWQDNANDEDSLVVEMASIYTNGVFLFLKRLPANSTSFLVNKTNVNVPNFDLEPNQTYFFRVSAENEFGFSPTSNADSARTFVDPTVPKPLAPSDLKAEPVSTIEISLRWRDNSTNETRFIVERSLNPTGPFSEIEQVVANTTSYSDLGLTAGQTYYYRIIAANGGGDSSPSDTTSAQAICNIITVINTDQSGNSSIACDTKQVLLNLNVNTTEARYQWYKNDVAIPEATLASYIASQTGEYYCRIIAGSCDKKSEVKSVLITPSFGVEISLDTTGVDKLTANRLGASSYQWYYEYAPIAGAINDSYVPSKSGTYYVIITDNGCSASSNTIFFDITVTGIEKYNISHLLKVFPNPAADELKLDLETGIQGDYEINLIDLNGRKFNLLKDEKSEFKLHKSFNINELANGMYFLEFKIGKFVGRKKIFKN